MTLLTIGLLVSDNNSVSIVGSLGEGSSIVVSIGCALLVTSVNLVLAAQAHDTEIFQPYIRPNTAESCLALL